MYMFLFLFENNMNPAVTKWYSKFEVDSVIKNLQLNLVLLPCVLFKVFEEAVEMEIVLIHISVHIALSCSTVEEI